MKPITNTIKFDIKKGNYTDQQQCAIEAIKIAFSNAKFENNTKYEMKLILQKDTQNV